MTRPPGDEIDVRAILARLWQGRKFIAIVIGVTLILAFVFLCVTTSLYTARMVLKPVNQNMASQGGDQFQAPALAPMGIKLPAATSTTPFQLFISLLTSTRLAGDLDRNHNLLKTVYEARWDPDRQQWKAPGGIKAKIEIVLNWLTGLPGWEPPSADTLAAYLQQNLSITVDDNTGLATIKYTDTDPKSAAQMLTWMHTEADDIIKADVLKRTEKNVAYLKSKLEGTSLAETRKVLVDLMMTQEHTLMLMSSGLPFAAEFVVPPFPPTSPSYPKAIFIMILAGIAGFIAGCGLLLTWGWARKGGFPWGSSASAG